MAHNKIKNLRLWIQIGFTALTNGYLGGYIRGTIYQGSTKRFCLPGLNCYSCPGALGSCPIGALQAVVGSRNYQFSYYVIGFLAIVGALVGRLVCGFLCPFGLIQDLLYKIPFIKKFTTVLGERYLSLLRYVILALFVLLLPMFAVNLVGQGDPWFCKWICPAGTLMGGIPLVLQNESLQAVIGWLYAWKLLLLAVTVFASIVLLRPFCRFICPLGAIYGLCNPISLYSYRCDPDLCTKCGRCKSACKMGLTPYRNPNSPACIRCGACIRQCPHHALSSSFCVRSRKNKKQIKI